MKRILSRVFRWQYIWLCLIVLTVIVIQLCIINSTDKLILDEKHYVEDARNIIDNFETLRAEHPPLAKQFVVLGIKAFGDNPWGWRVFPALFGTVSIVLFYFICRRLDMTNTASSIATFLLAFDNMVFVQASVAMLDVYYVTFMLASFLLYLNRRFITAGIAVGLSALGKLVGVLALPVMVIHWIFDRWGRSFYFVLVFLTALLAFVLLMPLFDLAIVQNFSEVQDPVTRVEVMMEKSGSLTFETVEHDYASRPWEWVIKYFPMPYWYEPSYTSAMNPALWALIMPIFVYMVVMAIRGSKAGLFGAAWFTGIYLIWIPLTFITNRVSYPYYFYPAVGSICIGVAMVLSQFLDIFRKRKYGKLKWAAITDRVGYPTEGPVNIGTAMAQSPPLDIFRKRKYGKLKWTLLVFVVLYLVIHLVSFILLSPLVFIDVSQW